MNVEATNSFSIEVPAGGELVVEVAPGEADQMGGAAAMATAEPLDAVEWVGQSRKWDVGGAEAAARDAKHGAMGELDPVAAAQIASSGGPGGAALGGGGFVSRIMAAVERIFGAASQAPGESALAAVPVENARAEASPAEIDP